MNNKLVNIVDDLTAPTTSEEQPVMSSPIRTPWKPMESYTVQQAAALTGLSEHTLRYYEKIGLITPVPRQESSGHRRYTSDDLSRLDALACLRATGMPIDQMRHYLELRTHGADAAVEQQALLTEHLDELQRRMVALQTHMEYVALKVDYWRAIELHDDATAASKASEAKELVRTAFVNRDI